MHARLVPGHAGQHDPRLDALLRRLAEQGHPGLSERKRLDRSDPAPGSFGIEYDDEDGHLVGYLHCVAGPARWTVELLAHPQWRGRVEPEMLAVLYVTLLAQGGGALTWWTTDPGQEQLARAWGWKLERRLDRLERPIAGIEPVPADPSTTLRPFVDGPGDRAALLAVNNAAFAGHPEQGGWSPQDVARRIATDWFDPAHLLIAERADRPVGFCWLKWHGPERRVEVYAIATVARRAPAGTGRALLTTALHGAARSRSGAMASLYVDAANERAGTLYRSLGFAPAEHQLAYQVSVPDGRPPRHARARPDTPARHRLGVRPGEAAR